MEERSRIIINLTMSGLFQVMPVQTVKVLCAIAILADPDTQELTMPVDKIAREVAWQVNRAAELTGAVMFPDQITGVFLQLSEVGIVERVSDGDPPTYRFAADYKRLVEIKKMIAEGEELFPYVAPGPTNFRERNSRPL